MIWVMFPTVGALIGWLTNVTAIRLLFRPREPVRIFKNFVIQGLLPRRRHDIALTIGEIVEAELLSKDRLMAALFQPDLRDEMVATAAGAAERAVVSRMPPFVPRGLRNLIMSYVRDATKSEVQQFTIKELPNLIGRCFDQIDIAGQVRERVESLDFGELEDLAVRLARRELRHIEWLGAVLGFLVGLVQALIFQLLN